MKILFYSPHSQLYFEAPTGYGSHMRGMVAGFEELGHEVEILVMGKLMTSVESKPSEKSKLKKWIPTFIWRTMKEIQWIRFDKKAAQCLEEKIKEFQPHLIYERSAWMSDKSSRVIKKYNIPHVVEINAPLEQETKSFEGSFSFTHWIGKKKFKNILSNCNAIASINSKLTAYLIGRYDLPLSKFIFTPNAISTEELKLAEQARVHEKISPLTSNFVFGFVGSIFPYHGIDKCIRAFACMKNTNSHLLIVGDGYSIPQYQKLAQQLDIQSQITFTGAVAKSEIWNYLAGMDVYLLPSTAWYCSPVKLFEYAAMNKPIIAVDQAGVTDIFSPKACTIFDGSVEKLSSIFKAHFHSKETYINQALEAKKIIMDNHIWHKNASKIIAHLHQ
jgi:glycosyltransferase involved in cell wall biosynthesis